MIEHNSDFDIEITPQELYKLDALTYELIDVREPIEKSIADIGGRLIPLYTIPSIEDDELLKAKRVILYCHHGVRSLQAAHYLYAKGFFQVQSLKGGICLWSKEIDNTIPLY